MATQLPWGGSATLATAGTTYNIAALVAANSTPFSVPNARRVAVSIQSGKGNGGALIFIGNAAVSSSNHQDFLIYNQQWTPPFGFYDTVQSLSNLFVTSDTDASTVNIGLNVLSYV